MPDYDKQRPKVQPPVVPLSAHRASRGLTQADVATRVSAITNKPFSKGAVAAIELGHRGASAETLAAFEAVYGLPSGSLVVSYPPSHDRRRAEDIPA